LKAGGIERYLLVMRNIGKRAWQIASIQIHLASSFLLIHITGRECSNNIIDVESITTNLLFDKHRLGPNGETRKLRLKDIS
jgi:hypothetical protein